MTNQPTLPNFKDVAPGEVPDFQVEDRPEFNVTYYTPYTGRAHAWAYDNLKDVPMHGRSYMFKMNGDPKKRASKLKGFLRKEGYVVSR